MTPNTGTINAQAASEDFEFEALARAVNYRRCLIHEFLPYLKGDVLEIGAGIGQFTEDLLSVPTVKSIHAAEPDARFYSTLIDKKLPIQTTYGTAEDLDPAKKYEAIVSVNVLEHIDNHADELIRYSGLLKPGGHLCLFVPACPLLYAPIDRHFGHFRRYRRGELRQELETAGFQISKLYYYNSVGVLAWWFNFCVLKKMHFEIGKVELYDRYIFPTVHAVESLGLRPPIGQSLLAIARV